MNIKEAFKLLQDYLTKYNSESFILHPAFIEDLKNLLSKDLNGKEDKFFQGLSTQLDNIASHKRLVYKIDSNEILKNTGVDSLGKPYELISIHIASNQYNIRLIIRFKDDNNPIFLVAFNEKQGKKKSKNSYQVQIAIAKERLAELS